ncbi:MAG TPA: hypothetical protein PKC97_11620 [Burkholderiaceae bacterium]|nr:hypothetical protein [Burkholderiaceae bacterium]
MATARNGGAEAPGPVTPTSDEAPAGRTAQGFKGQAHQVSLDCRRDQVAAQPATGQALLTIAGERKAGAYLARLHCEQADPDELAVIVSMLYGATLRGFCRVIEKAIGGRHA